MLFSSLEFLFLFLPLCVGTYYLLPKGWRNAVLLVFSLIFYAFGEPIYLFLMLITLLSDYIFALAIEKATQSNRNARKILAAAVIFNLFILAFFKYFDPLLSALSKIPQLSFIKPVGLPLPVGISFYTFQSLSYVIDVYRERVKAERNIILPATYVTLFPQLVAGPIVKYGEIADELVAREHSVALCAEGLRRFCAGLAKKVVLANMAGEMWRSFAVSFTTDTDVLSVWLGIIFFSFQIYFDFSGYSDMALGLGKIFGFHFPENFNYPYISRSISDFWKRWHITLSSWFKEYLYIPLGGNRRGKLRTYLNLLVVWSLTGLWHGASLNFLLWGLYFFIILSLEKAFLLRLLTKLPIVLQHGYALILILIGWLIFAADGAKDSLTLNDAASCLKIIVGASGNQLFTGDSLYQLLRNIIPICIMAIGSTPLLKRTLTRICSSEKRERAKILALNTLSLLSLLLSTAYLVDSGYNPFLYFRF